MLNKNKKLYIAGHNGMVGTALFRKFTVEGFNNIVVRSSSELDLRRQSLVEEFFEQEKPHYVIIAAAKVGGILANNTYRAEFIYDNLMIETNLIHSAYKYGCEKLIFLGSSCIYPKNAPQPLKEECLLTNELEYTNEPYAIAKIAGLKLCENYFKQYGCNFYSVMPSNLYGPNDNFDLRSSHVLPALIRKFYEAKIHEKDYVEVWGSGKPRREFLYVEDLADAIFILCNNVEAEEIYKMGINQINIGTGNDISIYELAEIIKKCIGFEGIVNYNISIPDGTLQKLLDVSRVNKLGWKSKTDLVEGINKTINWFLTYTNSIII